MSYLMLSHMRASVERWKPHDSTPAIVMILLHVKDSLVHSGLRNIYTHMKLSWNVYDDSEKRWGNE